MPLQLELVTDPKDFDKIMQMEYEAWQTPYNPQLKHFRPNLPTRAESIRHTIAKNTKKLLENDPDHFFINVIDTDTDEVVGFAAWMINHMNEDGDEKTIAYWHPEGSEEKEFAECFIDGLFGFLGEKVKRKHMGEL